MNFAVADHLSTLVQIPTVSAGSDDTDMGPFEQLMSALPGMYPGLYEHLSFERIGDLGLLFRWTGGNPDLADHPVVLMAHFDVVPADLADPWTHPPFGGVIADGKVFGRGALDDKGALVVLLDAVESLVGEGFQPVRDVYLSLGGNEETLGAAAAEIANTIQARGLTPWFVLDEGGAVVDAPLSFVQVTSAMVGVGEKGVMTVQLAAAAEPGHASAPGRFTAVSRLARAINRLGPGTFPARLPASVGAMLSAFIPHTSGPAQAALKAMVKAPAATAQLFARLGGEPAALVRTTVAATMISGGTANNVLPSSATAVLNLRVAMDEKVAGVMARLKRAVHDDGIAVTLLDGSEPSPQSPTNGPQFDAITQAVKASYPEAVTVPYVMMAATDPRHFHRFSPAVYRFAPLAMTAAQRASIHGVDEWVTIDSLERGVTFYRRLIELTGGAK
ncbi:MAG: M20/M25/M40 family metallo-hydrolase [Propionibacteriaceae bacterium]|nr:M20/M25/M40 family metallo-hydrolase [Propionibacteriaceae bacterium]